MIHPLQRLTPLLFMDLLFAYEDKTKTSSPTAASTSAPAHPSGLSPDPLPPLKLESFQGLGLSFTYPKPYQVETVTTNPQIHQIAIDHNQEPGVLVIRFDPSHPAKPMVLDEIGEATRQRMDAQATMTPSTLMVAGQRVEARTIHSTQLGLVSSTDVVAIVTIKGTNYVVLTHTADADAQRAQRMFDTVLQSLAGQSP